MRYEITQSQKAYFEKNKMILFEDFLPKETEELLKKYRIGFDLWRNHPEIKKIVCNKELGELLYQLTLIKPIRLLFDQAVKDETIDLRTSSFQGLYVAILLQASSLTIFSTDTPFSVEGQALLVAYGGVDTVFAFKENDPFAPNLKKLGYTYGDALNSDDYPLIYR